MSPKKVMVVEPSDVMRKILVRSLQSVGITEALDTGDGQQALDWIGEHQFDLILTEWEVPGKTGLELLESLRKTEKSTPVLMITHRADKADVLTAIQAGVSDYLIKPFTADVLLDKIRKLASV
jgi:two-component system chemotaxis response regulator CheY